MEGQCHFLRCDALGKNSFAQQRRPPGQNDMAKGSHSGKTTMRQLDLRFQSNMGPRSNVVNNHNQRLWSPGTCVEILPIKVKQPCPVLNKKGRNRTGFGNEHP